MAEKKYPFAVRLVGFAPAEAAQVGAMLALAPPDGPAYCCLHDHSLQEPDLFIAQTPDIRAVAALAALRPGALQPALLVGGAPVDLPHPRIERPLDPLRLFDLLGRMVAERAEAVARITARGGPAQLPERRRQQRLDFDLTDPAVYLARRKSPPNGAVLVVDRNGALRDRLAALFGGRPLSVEWTDSAATAVRLCEETPVSVVFVNTSTPDLDPYALCAAIKQGGGRRVAVVLLVGATFDYEPERALAAGVRGILDKPVADRHLSATLKKLLSLPA